MRDGGRIAAAIAVLADIEERHKPVRLALKAWGDASRFAGAKDRAWVSGLALDVLRRRRSLAFRMDDGSNRAAVFGALGLVWGWPVDRVEAAAADEPHGPGALTPAERSRLSEPVDLSTAPPDVRGDYPAWLDKSLARVFGDERAEEGAALAERAPIDLRVNTLKSDPPAVLEALENMGVQPAGYLPTTLRIAAPAASERAAPVEAHPVYLKGWVEVQDAGSQLAAACAGDIAGKQVLDYCAGGGGKTLALAALMRNKGQVYAYDSDARRMKDLIPRAERAGVRNLQMRTPLDRDPLGDLVGKMDVVFVDAPCTGSGTWRRHPDAKWRLSPEQLKRRMAEQDKVLREAAVYVKPGGRLVYVTCSLLAEENEDRLAAFVGELGYKAASLDLDEVRPFITPEGYLRLTPKSAGTDGFFAAVIVKG